MEIIEFFDPKEKPIKKWFRKNKSDIKKIILDVLKSLIVFMIISFFNKVFNI